MRIILIFILVSCSCTFCDAQVEDNSKMQTKSIEQVMKENRENLLAIPGVQGFYQGMLEDESDCIVVMINEFTEEIQKQIPDTLEGFPVVIEEGGEIIPLHKKQND